MRTPGPHAGGSGMRTGGPHSGNPSTAGLRNLAHTQPRGWGAKGLRRGEFLVRYQVCELL